MDTYENIDKKDLKKLQKYISGLVDPNATSKAVIEKEQRTTDCPIATNTGKFEITKSDCECAHHIRHKYNGMCMSEELFKKIIEHYKEHIEQTKDQTNERTNEQMLKLIKTKLECSSESCILAHPNIKHLGLAKKELSTRFLPSGPKNTQDWLDNFNIDETNILFKKFFPGFVPFGYQMIDFMQKGTTFARANIPMLIEKGMKTSATVINTDYSTGSGLHWFAIFIDARKPTDITVEYFNSSGNKPPEEIQRWLYNTIEDINIHRPHMMARMVKMPPTRIQKDDHSCGVYSLFYIFHRNLGYPIEQFNERNISDQMMHIFRWNLFRTHK